MNPDREATLNKLNIYAGVLICIVIVGTMLACNVAMIVQNKPQFLFTEAVSADAATFNAIALGTQQKK